MHSHFLNNKNFPLLLECQYRTFSDQFLKGCPKTSSPYSPMREDSFSSTSTAESAGSISPPEGRSPLNKSKYQITLQRRHKNYQVKKKTELCKTFLLGFECPYGSKCSFAHGTEELRGKVLVPNNYKTSRCKQFHELGYCNYGPRCQFVHKPKRNFASPTVSFRYKDVYMNMCAGHEEEEDSEFIERMNLEDFGFRRLEVFHFCHE